MKLKVLSFLSFAILLSAAGGPIAYADDQGSGRGVSGEVKAQAEIRVNDDPEGDSSGRGSDDERAGQEETSSGRSGDDADRAEMEDEHATSTPSSGRDVAEAHRSAVASFVQSLLAVADREDGIGAEVREIAQTQNATASTTAEAAAKVDNRNRITVFLFGSDYKNLGVLRSGVETTRSNIARLTAVLDKTTNAADRAELEAQIQALEDNQVEIEAFADAHESSFSLFGWLTRLFLK